MKVKLEFDFGNVLELNEEEKYDVVITSRCLINLENHDQQVKAISNIKNCLSENGVFLMIECTKKGLSKINEVRKTFDLETINERWHNYYLEEEKILEYVKQNFKSVEISNFNSTYFLISRTINALLTPESQQIDYNSDLNKYAAQLPPMGDYAPLKLFIIRK